jgi:glycosyltransferase involved in cell wall biosynthesis
MKQTCVSVIICTYDRAEMLRQALESVIFLETDGDFYYEIIIVDNGSTDATQTVVQEIIKKSSVPIKCIFEPTHGISQARNRGIKEAKGEWIAFFDDDQLAEHNWLRELFTFANKKGAHCVGGSRELCLSSEELSGLSPITRMILGETFGQNEPGRCQRKSYPSCGNVLIRRDVFDMVGQFDETLLRGGEDTDFFRRVRMAHLETWYTPKALVHHMVPRYRLSTEYLYRNIQRFGDSFAYRDYKEWGIAKTILVCLARTGQQVFITIPLLCWAYIRHDDAEVLGRKCKLWQALGYIRQTLYLAAPKIFAQSSYFSSLEFRKERQIFPKASNQTKNNEP